MENGFQANAFIGLVKFFRSDEYLEMVLDGRMHCQPPEVYRLHKDEGVSDHAESCMWSWREARGDVAVGFTINGHEVPPGDLVNITVHTGERKDSWLQCWTSLRIPKDEEGVQALQSDIGRMKAEFGSSYVFIPFTSLQIFLDRVATDTNNIQWYGEVSYTDNLLEWDITCKSTKYKYQREFRLAFGHCGTHEVSPLIFDHQSGFRDIFFKNADVKLMTDDKVWFDLKEIHSQTL